MTNDYDDDDDCYALFFVQCNLFYQLIMQKLYPHVVFWYGVADFHKYIDEKILYVPEIFFLQFFCVK
jgi:hypothetical protein